MLSVFLVPVLSVCYGLIMGLANYVDGALEL